MKRKHVVTSFLQYKGRILILRRSKKVGSFRGNWAGVSGYLEEGEDSLERALREIREEVGLTDREVELVQRGEPLEVPDREKRILWIVHPFLFKTRRREIQMDWEHVEHRWINPDKIDRFKTVPMLKETLDRVLPLSLRFDC